MRASLFLVCYGVDLHRLNERIASATQVILQRQDQGRHLMRDRVGHSVIEPSLNDVYCEQETDGAKADDIGRHQESVEGSSAIEIQAQQLGIVVVQERDEVQKNRNAAQAIEVLNALVPVRAENKQASPTVFGERSVKHAQGPMHLITY